MNFSAVPEVAGPVLGRLSRYALRWAANSADCAAAFRLRYEVFNEELGEGLPISRVTGMDRDSFDDTMRHLLVVEKRTGQAVGTYRLQTGQMALEGRGFYSAREFDFSPFAELEEHILELGRACIHRDHRSAGVVLLLWQGITDFALRHGCRYLLGCSSLSSQDASEGWAAFEQLSASGHLVAKSFRTLPLPGYQLPPSSGNLARIKIPRLLRAYLGVGARICGPPAMDREFGTIDFLTLLDLNAASPAASGHFLKSLERAE